MTLEGDRAPLRIFQYGVWRERAAREHRSIRWQVDDLILMRHRNAERRHLVRLHPIGSARDLVTVQPRAPTVRRRDHSTAIRFRHYLMTETDPDERRAAGDPLHEPFELIDPGIAVVNPRCRAGDQIDIVALTWRWQVSVAHVVVCILVLRSEQLAKHVAVAAKALLQVPRRCAGLENS